MKNIFSIKSHIVWLCMFAFFTVSCSNTDYVNAIPSSVTALVKLDAKKLDANSAAEVLKKVLPVDDIKESGIDFGSSIYAFETVGGNLGLCVKVKSDGTLDDTFSTLYSKGVCGTVSQRGDFKFTDIKNSWAVGYSDKALVVIGPVSAAALADTQRDIAKMLKQDEAASVVGSPIYECLDSMQSGVALVAQAKALPEMLVVPFMIGAPQNADASQVMIAADISLSDGVLKLEGETFSFNKSVDTELKRANAVFRSINGDYVGAMSDRYKIGFFVNVDGKQFLPVIQNNKPMQALLAGLNTAIDFDNIIRSIDGDFAVVSTDMATSSSETSMLAAIKHPQWVADVSYWKQSCPAGSSIVGENNAWVYKSGDTHFAFGLKGDVFYGTTDSSFSLSDAVKPVDTGLQDVIKGSRMAMIFNLHDSSAGDTSANAIKNILASVFGSVNAVAYVMK